VRLLFTVLEPIAAWDWLLRGDAQTLRADVGRLKSQRREFKRLLGLRAMNDYEELKSRAEELAQLARGTMDARIRNMLTSLSREFRLEAEQIMVIEGPWHLLWQPVPWFQKTNFVCPMPDLDHVALSLYPLC
jgi:hypothetical protein